MGMLAVLAALVVALVRECTADLPVHCVGDQLWGEWTFHLGPSGYTNSLSCGHSKPDNPKENWATKVRPYKVLREYKLTLLDNNTVVDQYNNQGTWTMIYDEGFEVRLGDRSFFAFSKFVPRPHMMPAFDPYGQSSASSSADNFQSVCTETVDGWYHFDNGTDWGCYYGKKAMNEAQAMALVNPMEILGPTGPSDYTDFLDVTSSSSSSSHPTSLHPTTPHHARDRHNHKHHHHKHHVSEAFGEEHRERVLHTVGKRVKQVNNSSRVSWSAREYPARDALAMLEIASTARKHVQVSAVPDPRADAVKYAGLPASLDWRNVDGVNYVPVPRKQGSCGSCFAIAATQMVEARIRIATKNRVQVQLSPQSILSCSWYAQGCDGGFPYLVGKHGQDYGFLEESCLPYQPKQALCSWHCKTPRVWYTSGYRYIGGAYGQCSEVHMMQEIKDHGPIVVGFNAPSDLYWYSDGIFHEEEELLSLLEVESGVPLHKRAFFEKTNHAVVAVGWGVEPQTNKKYWIVQNTWGEDWGDGGYFKIVRGEDVCAFEAMSVAFDPVIPADLLAAPPPPAAIPQPVPPATMPEPQPFAQRVQVNGQPHVIAGAVSGFHVGAVEEESDDEEAESLTPQQMANNTALEIAEGKPSSVPAPHQHNHHHHHHHHHHEDAADASPQLVDRSKLLGQEEHKSADHQHQHHHSHHSHHN